jgi:DNA topoisomerase-2
MPLWSLTQERVEKLRRQIGDKELEMDALIKLSKEDIWKKDLDDFLAEWRFQLEEEARRERKNANLGRRASSKLMTGGRAPAAKKRKADPEDEDYGGPKTKKAATVKKVAPKGGLLGYLNKPSAKPANNAAHDGADELDGDDDLEAEVLPKKSRGAPKAKAESKKETDEDVVEVSAVKAAPKPESQTRTNREPAKYVELSDSDSDNGDDLLDDVSKMVKGIGAAQGNSASDTRTLFSERSRPGSSAGLKAAAKSSKATSEFDPDETDYSKLVPQQTPRRSLLVKSKDAKDSKVIDDDDSEDGESAKAEAPKSKTTTKAKPTAATTAKPRGRAKREATKPAPAPVAKKAQPAPAAKGKAKKKLADDLSDDDIDAIANDILNSPAADKSDDEAPPARARPARRAATAAKKPTYIIDDDDSEMSEAAGDDSDDFDDFD